MPELETRETDRLQRGIDEDGAVVRERTRSVSSKSDPKTTIVNAVWFVYSVIGVLLTLRMVLKLFGANAMNGFVDFIYSVSGVLSAPFDGIFGVETATTEGTKSVFEPSILVAIVVYALIAWGVSKLLTLNEKSR